MTRLERPLDTRRKLMREKISVVAAHRETVGMPRQGDSGSALQIRSGETVGAL